MNTKSVSPELNDNDHDIIARPNVPGVTVLEGRAARLQQVFAGGVLIVPALGMIEALRLIYLQAVPGWAYLLFCIMYFVHMFGVTAGLHRMASHRGLDAPDWMKIVLTAMGSTAAQGPLLYWVSTHRRHHMFSDREGDPHSPNLHKNRWVGLWYSHMPWMLSRSVSTWTHYANDVLRDRALFFVHRTYLYWVYLGLLLPAAVGFILGSWEGAWYGFIFGGLARMFCANQSAWMVGSLSHRNGGVKFATDDHSRNNWLVAILAFGEGLQNNHHAFPVNYRHSIDWYEPDLTGWVLAIMAKFGLVRNLKFPSAEKIKQLRLSLREETQNKEVSTQ